MILVVWAASFGLDEQGLAQVEAISSMDQPVSNKTDLDMPTTIALASDKKARHVVLGRNRRDRKERTDAMLREILELIDFHGVMRRPTWDGVRALLLILPLMEGNLSWFHSSFCTVAKDLDS